MSEPTEITDPVNAQMPLAATLGIRTFGDAEEVEARLSWAHGLSRPAVCSTVVC